MSVLDEIKARIDIVDLISETVQLRRVGKNYTGFCPFHSNTRTPAFVVFPETGTWRCFGQCNEGGDIVGFVMKKEGWDFSEALRYLAERAGVQLRAPSPEEQAADAQNEALRSLLEDAVAFYRHNLFNTPAGQSALQYLRQKRELKDAIIEAFGLGYAPNSWEAATRYFKSKGYREEDLIACGLSIARTVAEGGPGAGIYDRFRHRLMFPIRDERGRIAGFGARILDPDDVPKFINSPQSALFDKGKLLYGLDLARKSIRTQDQAVIVEGYLDVIALHQAGFTNTVSPMGTALTEAQLRLLKRFTRRIVLALDADAAGDKATLRGLQIARQALEHETEPVFDARGLLGYESRLQADLRVTTLPEGMDPDEVVNRNPAQWATILENARPIVIHVMETLAKERDLDDPKAKSEIAAQVLPLIEDIPNAIEREDYRQRLARLLHIDERALIPSASRRGGVPSRKRFTPPAQQTQTELNALIERADPKKGRLALEEFCLGLLLRHPEFVYHIDRQLQRFGLLRLSQNDFQLSEHKALYRLIAESLEQNQIEPLTHVLNNLSLPLMDLADRLLSKTAKLEASQDRLIADLLRALLSLRQREIRQNIEHIRFMFEEAQQTKDTLANDQYFQTIVQYNETRKRLDLALEKFTSHFET